MTWGVSKRRWWAPSMPPHPEIWAEAPLDLGPTGGARGLREIQPSWVSDSSPKRPWSDGERAGRSADTYSPHEEYALCHVPGEHATFRTNTGNAEQAGLTCWAASWKASWRRWYLRCSLKE